MDSVLKLPTPKKVMILVAILCGHRRSLSVSLFHAPTGGTKFREGGVKQIDQRIKWKSSITRDLEKFKGQVEKLNEELKDALTQLPNEKEIPEILKNISSLGRNRIWNSPSLGLNRKSLKQFYARSLSSW